MIDPLTYNIPAARIDAYRGRRLVVRSRLPAEIIACLTPEALPNLAYIQLLSAEVEGDDLIHWGVGVPVDVVIQDPHAEFPLLYRLARLLENHPVRLSVPVVAGFSKAVKLALALNFAVKLELVRQPEWELIEELFAVLDLYLHRSTVSQPVEWFHSLLLAACWEAPTSLWSVQEEDPARVRYVTDEGEETISPRFAGTVRPPDLDDFVAGHQAALLAKGSECAGCDFFGTCGGYFKWPREEYRCDGVKSLFRTLTEAAEELRQDLRAALDAPAASPQ
jgi:hypothetical protein